MSVHIGQKYDDKWIKFHSARIRNSVFLVHGCYGGASPEDVLNLV